MAIYQIVAMKKEEPELVDKLQLKFGGEFFFEKANKNEYLLQWIYPNIFDKFYKKTCESAVRHIQSFVSGWLCAHGLEDIHPSEQY